MMHDYLFGGYLYNYRFRPVVETVSSEPGEDIRAYRMNCQVIGQHVRFCLPGSDKLRTWLRAEMRVADAVGR